MEFRKVKTSEMHPAPYNPRIDIQPGDPEYEHIKNSIDQLGYIDPIIWNERTGNIVGGHQRYKVLTAEGYTELDVVVVQMDDATEKAANMALNKAVGLWDEDKLAALINEMEDTKFDMGDFGFDLEKYLPKEPEDDNFDPEQAYEDIDIPVTQRGDIYILGDHRLMCGDSCSAEDMAWLMGGQMAELVVTDPPYNVNYGDKAEYLDEYLPSKGEGHRNQSHIANDNMDNESFYKFLYDFYTNTFNHMVTGAAIYVFHAESTGHIFRQAFIDAGLKLAQCLIWVKNTFVLGRQDYQWKHEPCLYGWKEGSAHYFTDDRTLATVEHLPEKELESMKKDELLEYSKKMREAFEQYTTIILEDKPRANDLHPTMKPIPLIGRLVQNSSRAGWNVLDPFGGSGSTLMACEQLGRKAFLMEFDPKYCDVIVQRWESLTGKTAKRIPMTEEK